MLVPPGGLMEDEGNIQCKDWRPILLAAASAQLPWLVELLLELGADPAVVCGKGCMALHAAVAAVADEAGRNASPLPTRSLDTLTLLLSQPALDPTVADAAGNTAVHLINHPVVLRLLLDACADKLGSAEAAASMLCAPNNARVSPLGYIAAPCGGCPEGHDSSDPLHYPDAINSLLGFANLQNQSSNYNRNRHRAKPELAMPQRWQGRRRRDQVQEFSSNRLLEAAVDALDDLPSAAAAAACATALSSLLGGWGFQSHGHWSSHADALFTSPRPAQRSRRAVALLGRCEDQARQIMDGLTSTRSTHVFECLKRVVAYGTPPRLRWALVRFGAFDGRLSGPQLQRPQTLAAVLEPPARQPQNSWWMGTMNSSEEEDPDVVAPPPRPALALGRVVASGSGGGGSSGGSGGGGNVLDLLLADEVPYVPADVQDAIPNAIKAAEARENQRVPVDSSRAEDFATDEDSGGLAERLSDQPQQHFYNADQDAQHGKASGWWPERPLVEVQQQHEEQGCELDRQAIRQQHNAGQDPPEPINEPLAINRRPSNAATRYWQILAEQEANRYLLATCCDPIDLDTWQALIKEELATHGQQVTQLEILSRVACRHRARGERLRAQSPKTRPSQQQPTELPALKPEAVNSAGGPLPALHVVDSSTGQTLLQLAVAAGACSFNRGARGKVDVQSRRKVNVQQDCIVTTGGGAAESCWLLLLAGSALDVLPSPLCLALAALVNGAMLAVAAGGVSPAYIWFQELVEQCEVLLQRGADPNVLMHLDDIAGAAADPNSSAAKVRETLLCREALGRKEALDTRLSDSAGRYVAAPLRLLALASPHGRRSNRHNVFDHAAQLLLQAGAYLGNGPWSGSFLETGRLATVRKARIVNTAQQCRAEQTLAFAAVGCLSDTLWLPDDVIVLVIACLNPQQPDRRNPDSTWDAVGTAVHALAHPFTKSSAARDALKAAMPIAAMLQHSADRDAAVAERALAGRAIDHIHVVRRALSSDAGQFCWHSRKTDKRVYKALKGGVIRKGFDRESAGRGEAAVLPGTRTVQGQSSEAKPVAEAAAGTRPVRTVYEVNAWVSPPRQVGTYTNAQFNRGLPPRMCRLKLAESIHLQDVHKRDHEHRGRTSYTYDAVESWERNVTGLKIEVNCYDQNAMAEAALPPASVLRTILLETVEADEIMDALGYMVALDMLGTGDDTAARQQEAEMCSPFLGVAGKVDADELEYWADLSLRMIQQSELSESPDRQENLAISWEDAQAQIAAQAEERERCVVS